MAVGVERLLRDEPLRLRLGENAVKDAEQRFDIQRQADDLLQWYQEILQAWASRQGPIPAEQRR
jgi:glycosyltransferase involved in cell wall biosynthesis